MEVALRVRRQEELRLLDQQHEPALAALDERSTASTSAAAGAADDDVDDDRERLRGRVGDEAPGALRRRQEHGAAAPGRAAPPGRAGSPRARSRRRRRASRRSRTALRRPTATSPGARVGRAAVEQHPDRGEHVRLADARPADERAHRARARSRASAPSGSPGSAPRERRTRPAPRAQPTAGRTPEPRRRPGRRLLPQTGRSRRGRGGAQPRRDPAGRGSSGAAGRRAGRSRSRFRLPRRAPGRPGGPGRSSRWRARARDRRVLLVREGAAHEDRVPRRLLGEPRELLAEPAPRTLADGAAADDLDRALSLGCGLPLHDGSPFSCRLRRVECRPAPRRRSSGSSPSHVWSSRTRRAQTGEAAYRGHAAGRDPDRRLAARPAPTRRSTTGPSA